ncbi:hypothetical protein VARIO8X_60189 [Burkholderiales bacterium 8X]|nr:hypothetical protein VARIO8X_60189 [Burkholderiales bacterium 8X]
MLPPHREAFQGLVRRCRRQALRAGRDPVRLPRLDLRWQRPGHPYPAVRARPQDLARIPHHRLSLQRTLRLRLGRARRPDRRYPDDSGVRGSGLSHHLPVLRGMADQPDACAREFFRQLAFQLRTPRDFRGCGESQAEQLPAGRERRRLLCRNGDRGGQPGQVPRHQRRHGSDHDPAHAQCLLPAVLAPARHRISLGHPPHHHQLLHADRRRPHAAVPVALPQRHRGGLRRADADRLRRGDHARGQGHPRIHRSGCVGRYPAPRRRIFDGIRSARHVDPQAPDAVAGEARRAGSAPRPAGGAARESGLKNEAAGLGRSGARWAG